MAPKLSPKRTVTASKTTETKAPDGAKLLGGAQWHHGAVRFRLSRAADKTRKWRDLRDALGDDVSPDQATALDQGRRLAHKLSVERIASGVVAPALVPEVTRAHGELVSAWFARWLASRIERGKVETGDEDTSLFKNHIAPIIGHLPIAHVSTLEIELIVERLDGLIMANELAWKSAKNAWGTLRAMFRDACHSKDRALRVRERDDNPTDGVEGPELGDDRISTILYPTEYLKLVTARAIWEAKGENVNRARAARRWMRLVSIAIYMNLRVGEIRALFWERLDLEHLVAEIHKAARRGKGRQGQLKAPKKGSVRTFRIRAEIVPLLKAMRAEAAKAQGVANPTGPIIAVPPKSACADYLRELLELAGCDRESLHVSDNERRHLTFHDLRATGISWRILAGDDHNEIQGAAGHKAFSTTEGYIRTTNLRGAGIGQPFPEIPAIVLGTVDALEPLPFAAAPPADAVGCQATANVVPERSHKLDGADELPGGSPAKGEDREVRSVFGPGVEGDAAGGVSEISLPLTPEVGGMVAAPAFELEPSPPRLPASAPRPPWGDELEGRAPTGPQPGPTEGKVLVSKRFEVTPMGIENGTGADLAGDRGRSPAFDPRDPVGRPFSRAVSGPEITRATRRNDALDATTGTEVDPIDDALRAGLERAIAKGRAGDAAKLAVELANRAARVAADVVDLEHARLTRRP
jgi:integrase